MSSSLVVTRYSPDQAAEWNAFVGAARNGLFLFRRGYMDYHADRFPDASLLIRDEGRLIALLPASHAAGALLSHSGLTFGGLVFAPSLRAAQVVAALGAVRDALSGLGYSRLVYKQVPPYFYEPLSSEDSYALFRAGARLTRVDANFVLDVAARPAIQERRQRSMKKARKAGVEVGESGELARYWSEVLVPVLEARHGVAPVHTIAEMELLKARFPENIRLFVATREGRVVAGTVLYLYRGLTHAQYIAANDEGRETGALDLVFGHILEQQPPPARFFSFGISTEEQGRVLNEGLAEWKEGFGARSVPHCTWEVS